MEYTGDSSYSDTSENGTFEYRYVQIPELTDLSGHFMVDFYNQGFLIFLIDDKQIFNDFYNGPVMIQYENLTVGDHKYEIIMYDKSNNLVFDENGTFHADYDFTPFVNEYGYSLQDEIKIVVRVPEDATGQINVTYKGINSTYELNGEDVIVVLKDLELGSENITFTYLGDEKYPQKTVKSVISILGYQIIAHEKAGRSWISLTLPADATGKLNISLTNDYKDFKTFLGSADFVDGTANYVLPPGNYFIWAEYNGTDYNVEDLVWNFEVLPDIKFPLTVIMGEDTTLDISASNASENFKIFIGEEEIYNGKLDEISDGYYSKTINVPEFKNLGDNLINVWYNGTQLDDQHRFRFTVLPGTLFIPQEFGFDKSANLTLNLSEYAKGNVSVTAYGDYGQKYVLAQNVSVSGNAIVPLSAEKSGNYMLLIEYVDEQHGIYQIQTPVHVPNADAGSEVVIPQTVTSDTLEINLPKNATGSVLAIIDGNSYIYELVDGSAKIDLSAIPKGPHNLTIKYTGDEKYERFEKTGVFSAKATSSVIIEPVTNVTYGEPVVVKYSIENRTNQVTVTIAKVGGEIVNATYTLNENNVTITNLAAGNYRIFIFNNPDEKYERSQNSTLFTVAKADADLEVSVKVDEYGLINIEARVDSKATGNVTFVVLNETGDAVAKTTEDIVNGIATFAELTKYAKGNYNYLVTYNGDNNYDSTVIYGVAPVTISKDYISPKITQLDVEGGEINVTVDLGVNATGKVHVVYPSGYVDNVTIENGKVNFNAVFMKETGPMTLVLDYDGDDNYYGFFEYFIDFTIKKATFITAKPISVVYKNNAKWTINLKDADLKPVAGQTIKVTVNGKTYSAKTDAKGNAVVTIPANMVPKPYTAKIVFAGTALVDDDFENVKFTVKKATPKLTAKKKTFKAKTKVKKYTVVLKDHKKKAMKKVKVYIKVKGKTYKATTNKKGKATFKIKNLKKKGTYKAKVTFKATKYFNKVTKTVKIKVKR